MRACNTGAPSPPHRAVNRRPVTGAHRGPRSAAAAAARCPTHKRLAGERRSRGGTVCGACACAPFRRRVVTRPPNSNLVSTAAAASHHTHTSISPAGRPRPRPQSKATRVIISTSAVAFLRMCVHHINIVTYSIIVRAFVFPARVRPSIVVLFRP